MRLGQRLSDYRIDDFDVLARSNLREYAAVLDHCGSGLIARSLDAEYARRLQLLASAGHRLIIGAIRETRINADEKISVYPRSSALTLQWNNQIQRIRRQDLWFAFGADMNGVLDAHAHSAFGIVQTGLDSDYVPAAQEILGGLRVAVESGALMDVQPQAMS